MKKQENSIVGTVYSTELGGRTCPKCANAVQRCRCKKEAAQRIQGDGNVRIFRSSKGRKGKGVSVISGLQLSLEDLKSLAKELKSLCGTGGTVKDGNIEIQGDQRTVLLEALKQRGIAAKIAGG